MIRRVRLAAALLALAAVSACSRPAPPAAHASPGPTALAAAPSAPAWSASEIRALQAQLRAVLGASALATSAFIESEYLVPK